MVVYIPLFFNEYYWNLKNMCIQKSPFSKIVCNFAVLKVIRSRMMLHDQFVVRHC